MSKGKKLAQGSGASSFTEMAGIEVPIICGAMYPCSNPELVAAVSEAGGLGVIQPLSLTYVHGYDFREGLRYIRSLTKRPVALNLIIEQSSQRYMARTREWLDIALEEGIKFYVTALGKPDWVVDKVKAHNGIVFHDVTEKKWAAKAIDQGVDGLICVNNRAGGHAGRLSAQRLLDDMRSFGVPLISAGGIGSADDFCSAIDTGYSGCQLGTRFIATKECSAHVDYKNAILNATEKDIVLTDKISGVPVSVINTPSVQRMGTKAGPVARVLLRGNKTKHWMRTFYTLQSLWKLKKASANGMNYRDYFQAGKSADGINKILPAGDVVRQYAETLDRVR